MIKAKELAQETLQKALEKRRNQKEQAVDVPALSEEEVALLVPEMEKSPSLSGRLGGTIDNTI